MNFATAYDHSNSLEDEGENLTQRVATSPGSIDSNISDVINSDTTLHKTQNLVRKKYNNSMRNGDKNTMKKHRKNITKKHRKKGIRRYFCDLCGFSRSRRSRLKHHVLQKHGIEDLEKEGKKVIKRVITSYSAYKEKRKCVCAEKGSSNKTVFSKGQVFFNENDDHAGRLLYSCEECEVSFDVLSSLELHKKNCPSESYRRRIVTRYRCKLCGITRAKRSRLNSHVLDTHANEVAENMVDDEIEKVQVDCESMKHLDPENVKEMGIRIPKRSLLSENGSCSNRDIRRYRCRICGIHRSKLTLLKSHIISTHGEDVLQEMGNDAVEKDNAISSSYKDIRRYKCHICSTTRSKRSLLNKHIKTCHADELQDKEAEMDVQDKQFTCEDCGASFKKLSHLSNHKISHKQEKPFHCTADGCSRSYRRKSSLNRHMLKHEGKTFQCPKEGCQITFSTFSNLKRHLQLHERNGSSWQCQRSRHSSSVGYTCPEPSCSKVFKAPSRLAKHLDDVHCNSTSYDHIICCEPECLEQFKDVKLLQKHVQEKHSRICCEVCGSQQLKKQITRHMQIHEEQKKVVDRIRCPYERCLHSYTKKSNLTQHIRAVHEGVRRFKCGFDGCGMSFAYKSIRDKHEKSRRHNYIDGNFEQEDMEFQSRSKAGRKRKLFTVDSILRKKSCSLEHTSIFEDGFSYVDWLMSVDES